MRQFDFLPVRALALNRSECSIAMQESYSAWDTFTLAPWTESALKGLALKWTLEFLIIDLGEKMIISASNNGDNENFVMSKWLRSGNDFGKDTHLLPIIEFPTDKDFIVAKMRFT
jgi:hypothetical protein